MSAPTVAYPKIIGANGPKMLALSGEIAVLGRCPRWCRPKSTAQARQVLGPGKLPAIWVAWPLPPTATGSWRTPRRGRRWPGRPTRARHLRGYHGAAGCNWEQEIAEVGDRLVDAIIGHGGPAAIAARCASTVGLLLTT